MYWIIIVLLLDVKMWKRGQSPFSHFAFSAKLYSVFGCTKSLQGLQRFGGAFFVDIILLHETSKRTL